MTTHSEKFVRQRKLFTALPVLVTPFLALFFWALGGGTGSSELTTPEAKGLNTQIPSARLKDSEGAWDKFSLYERAERDSLRKAEAERTDPYFRLKTIPEIRQKDSFGRINHSLGNRKYDIDSNEVAIRRKIREINFLISEDSSSKELHERGGAKLSTKNMYSDESIDRLEAMMLMMQTEGPPDPGMTQIENVLEKILDVQHPERVRERIQNESLKDPGKVFPVSSGPTPVTGRFFGSRTSKDSTTEVSTGFYGPDEPEEDKNGNMIRATVSNTQTLMNNSIAKLRLVDDVYINGNLIARDAFVYGVCKIQNERISIDISSIFSGSTLYPVSLTAYDVDGLEGLYIPGTLTNDAARQGSNQMMQDLEIMSIDPSIGAQAASAGIQTAKTLLGKKSRVIKVQIKAGHKVFLLDASNRNQF